MKYIGITQQTASWLFTRPSVLSCIHELIIRGEGLSDLRHADLAEGSFRLSGSPDGKMLAIWHLDYLSGTGSEEWGFIKRESPLGLLDEQGFSREVFEREIYLINQRLQGLLIDSAFYHRSFSNGAQSCMAGRGAEARHFSVGYIESDVPLGSGRTRSLICIGPSNNFDILSATVAEEARFLPSLIKLANDAIAPQRRRPILNRVLSPTLKSELSDTDEQPNHELANVTIPSLGTLPPSRDVYRTIGWTYDEWIKDPGPLSPIQRRILDSDGLLKHPIRIMGPGGSGKTLLMQLLAFRRLKIAEVSAQSVNIIYIVHNAAMARFVHERFETLGAAPFFSNGPQQLRITTLSDYGRTELQLVDTGVIDVDAHETKLFQLEQVKTALKQAFSQSIKEVAESKLLSQVANNEDLFAVFSRLVMAEISTAIKGHGLANDKNRYVGSERPLSRLHGLLTLPDRAIVFEAFERYHRAVFEELEVLDADDIALSLLGKMRTPIWELKRRTLGYDFVFVDETQLFNENERRLFPLLTRGTGNYVPIVLALDEAQELYGQSSAGFGALGIKAISNESLPSNHRSTRAIVDLAFFVIQQSTDLFGADFPDFTETVAVMEPDNHQLAAAPKIEVCNEEAKSFARFITRNIRELRKIQLRQIAIICHAEQYWNDLVQELNSTDLPVHVLLQRGDRIAPNHPLVVLTRPAYVGGQEFDAVIIVGLEQGLVPPRIVDNDALAAAVEQQALREIYLSVTRARYQLRIAINQGAKPTKVIQDAMNANLIN